MFLRIWNTGYQSESSPDFGPIAASGWVCCRVPQFCTKGRRMKLHLIRRSGWFLSVFGATVSVVVLATMVVFAACPNETTHNVTCPGQFTVCADQGPPANTANNWQSTCAALALPPNPMGPPTTGGADEPQNGLFGCQSNGGTGKECVGSTMKGLCTKKVFCIITSRNGMVVCATNPATPIANVTSPLKQWQNCLPGGH